MKSKLLQSIPVDAYFWTPRGRVRRPAIMEYSPARICTGTLTNNLVSAQSLPAAVIIPPGLTQDQLEAQLWRIKDFLSDWVEQIGKGEVSPRSNVLTVGAQRDGCPCCHSLRVEHLAVTLNKSAKGSVADTTPEPLGDWGAMVIFDWPIRGFAAALSALCAINPALNRSREAADLRRSIDRGVLGERT
ncbi:MAG: hypothetical protein K2P94_08490 [Rhodospirillaceae bacterium]|nr:hypothetical protein [Rhodospirillaceae bacterium]